jgi:hypothetical protein
MIQMSPGQTFELARIADRHGPLTVRALPADGLLVALERSARATAEVELDRRGRPRWASFTVEPSPPGPRDLSRERPQLRNPVDHEAGRPAPHCECETPVLDGGSCAMCGRRP